MATTVVFGGGPTPPEQIRSALLGVTPGYVIAADSGVEGCLAVGLHCDLLLGDMDSVSKQTLELARSSGTTIEHHDTDKDATDLELALDRAVERARGSGSSSSVDGAAPTDRAEVLVVGSGGGRLDHLLASVALLGSERFDEVDISAVLGGTTVVPVHRRRRIELRVGSTLTVLALHGAVSGLDLVGMRWPLRAAELAPGSTHGVSNVAATSTVEVAVTHGTATVLIPPPDPSPPGRARSGRSRTQPTTTNEETTR